MKGIISDLSDPMVLREFTPNARLVMQDKLSRGVEMVDIRVWNKWIQDNDYHPSKNGLGIVKADLIELLPKIMEHLGMTNCNTIREAEIK